MTERSREDVPDEVLVMAAILGDISAFDTLVLRYRPAVIRVAQPIVGAEMAEDVAQEAFMTAFKALPSLDDPGRFPSWLHVITRHKALRFNRRLRNRNMVELDHLLLERSRSLTLPFHDRMADMRTEVRQSIDLLPPEYALVIRLRFDDDMPLKRIAEFLGLPVTTVKWRLHKGKQLLKTIMEEHVYGSTA